MLFNAFLSADDIRFTETFIRGTQNPLLFSKTVSLSHID